MMAQPELILRYAVPTFRTAWLTDHLTRLNRRAAKLGVEPLSWSMGEEYRSTRIGDLDNDQRPTLERATMVQDVTITGQRPTLAGWRFVATCERVHTDAEQWEIITRSVPDERFPDEMRERAEAGDCDHCRTRRARIQVFAVVHEDGTARVVGRNCLQDFIGNASVNGLAEWACILGGLRQSLDEDFWDAKDRYEPTWTLHEWLAQSVAVIEAKGWRPKSRSWEGEPTASTVLWRFTIKPSELKSRDARQEYEATRVTDEHRAEADRVLEWIEAIEPNGSDYLDNLAVIGRAGYVKVRWAGLATSLIATYRKETERELTRAKTAAISQHVGEIGTRGALDLMVLGHRVIEGDWGTTTLYRFADPLGNIIVYFSSRNLDLTDGEQYRLVATIKRHEVRNGIAETHITRATKPKGGSCNGLGSPLRPVECLTCHRRYWTMKPIDRLVCCGEKRHRPGCDGWRAVDMTRSPRPLSCRCRRQPSPHVECDG
jgi:hypothetical protein